MTTTERLTQLSNELDASARLQSNRPMQHAPKSKQNLECELRNYFDHECKCEQEKKCNKASTG